MQRTELMLRGRFVPLSVGFLEIFESLVPLFIVSPVVNENENVESYRCESYGGCDYVGGTHCVIV